MSKIEVEFAFEIGDLVYVRGASHVEGVRPKQFVITERMAQECSGGIQKQYKLLQYDGFAPEIALCSEEPPYRPVSEDACTDVMRMQELMSTVRWRAVRGKDTEE